MKTDPAERGFLKVNTSVHYVPDAVLQCERNGKVIAGKVKRTLHSMPMVAVWGTIVNVFV
ncbi:hypothetical protein M514_03178 [Trichuris suis]|uniref:Uncharacterized protein n=1 Tax=Trichuris suis TaxID=68888 RepID=A0A085N953_9BILA|nr:hypothetical protein M513_03178 [Trichuris suis]KFD65999.1 hypothetical protein M514_03178 [Trichuris suis]